MDLGAYSTYSGESSPFIGQISKIATLFPWCYPCAYVQLTPWAAAHQGPQSMEFSRQEYWSGLPFPPPGDLPNPGIKPMFPHCRWILSHLSHQGSPVDSESSTNSLTCLVVEMKCPLCMLRTYQWEGSPIPLVTEKETKRQRDKM